jgi:xanthine dehydrogenase/oxidase
LEDEVRGELGRWHERRKELPSSGEDDGYKGQLASAFLYKAGASALAHAGVELPGGVASSIRDPWGCWPVSDGKQTYEAAPLRRPIGEPYIKVEALRQTTGQTTYMQDLPFSQRTVHAAVVQSGRALARYELGLPVEDDRPAARPAGEAITALRARLAAMFPSFVSLITYRDVPVDGSNHHGLGGDQPLFAEDHVRYAGQCIALVVATSENEAIRIADFVSRRCIRYEPIDWPHPWTEPVIGLEAAIARKSIFPDLPASAPWYAHIWRVTRPGGRFDWTVEREPLDRSVVTRRANVGGAPCAVVEATQKTGGQVHFYMEPQSCIAEPADDGRILVRAAAQGPMEMHQTVARALGVSNFHEIDVQIPAFGGGFGGKGEQARFVVGPVAVAAHACGRPVRLAIPRDQDTRMIGKRHPFYAQYQVAIDSGAVNPADRGILRGLQLKMWADGGAYYDCSFVVSDCAQLRADGAYRIDNFETQIDVCRTNTAANTAMRGFGGPQSITILESAIDDAAFAIGMTPEEVRELNLYRRGESTPHGQVLTHCYLREVWDFLKRACGYESKRAAVDEFNRNSRWRKRGLSMIPVKYLSGFNLVALEQASALVSVNGGDGSVTIYQGGVEMGQGLKTQVRQVAAYTLQVPIDLVYVESPRTSVVPNPTTTAASTGTTFNAQAVKQACDELRTRLMAFGYEMLSANGPEWCAAKGIDFWNYGVEGWSAHAASPVAEGQESAGPSGRGTQPPPPPPDWSPFAPEGRPKRPLVWRNLVQLAYVNRVGLMATSTTRIEGGSQPVPCRTYKEVKDQPEIPGIDRVGPEHKVTSEVDCAVGFTYSAACSVVEVDVLTGETKILSSDIAYDKGWSFNPAIDIGQVEGAFVQGVGYLVTENMVVEENGPERGRLNTVNTWGYKVPTTTMVPLELNVHLFPRDSVDVRRDPNDFLNTKEVGEPPLLLASTVFFAIKAAVRASRLERGLSGAFRLDAPATVLEVRRACEISRHDFAKLELPGREPSAAGRG